MRESQALSSLNVLFLFNSLHLETVKPFHFFHYKYEKKENLIYLIKN